MIHKLVSSIGMLSFSAAILASSSPQEMINKNVVTAFYNQAVNNKDYNAAQVYLGQHYIQHNPLVKNDKEGLKQFIHFLRTKYPRAHNEIKRIFVDGNFVILQVHSIRIHGSRGRAIFDLFRLENGKIVEHWDAIQEVPRRSENSNSMF